ncbi:MAG TPA: methyltransferase domain-containing protein [Acidimicrobiales bacterium]
MAVGTAFRAVHERALSPVEVALFERRRAGLLAKATGVVVDLGGGTGAHFASYRPGAVERVLVAGVDPAARTVVARRAGQATVPVELVDWPLGELEGADTVVAQLVLCTVPRLPALLAQVHRMLGRDGRLLFLEHVPSGLRTFRSLAAPWWRGVSGGCDLERDVPAAVRAAGFTILDLERFTVPTLNLPLRTCATGVARSRRDTPR